MDKILISGCLAGDVVRYDGRHIPLEDHWLKGLLRNGILCKCCPEVEGGMPIPRAPAQIVGGSGFDVLAGRATVVDVCGENVTRYFLEGAEWALSKVRQFNIKAALLKEKSPSCGCRTIYDGSFSSKLTDGVGVTTALLMENDVSVFSEKEILGFKAFIRPYYPEITK